MTIYLSIPISGLPRAEVQQAAETYRQQLIMEGYSVITPFDVCAEPNMSYAQCMGRDIEMLLQCDAIFLCPGWMNSRGCRLEWSAALIYGKEILDADDISNIDNIRIQ